MIETSMILCDRIRPCSLEAAKSRKLNKTKSKEIADSVDKLGLLQPVGLRKIEGDPDHEYEVVFGTHRIFAVSKILKQEAILARVFDFDADEAEMACITENLHRNPNKQAEFYAAIRAWSKYWEAKYPEKFGHNVNLVTSKATKKAADKAARDEAARIANMAKRENGTEAAPESTPVAAEIDSPKADSDRSFRELVAETTGQSTRTADRAIAMSKAFTPEQFAVLSAKEVLNADMGRLADIEDVDVRSRAVNLVASGLDVPTAVASVTGMSATSDAALVAESVKTEAEMGDREWLESHCAVIRDRLDLNTAAFDSSALLYRAIRGSLSTFKAKVSKRVAASLSAPPAGPFVRAVHQMTHVAHPRDWLWCSACSGKGKDPILGEKCRLCQGDGFKLKLEK